LADKDKLNQVMINLVRNAFEAISVGETVNCSIIKETSEQVCLRVQNWGKLIPVDVLPLLNQPFYSTKIGGTGLGLAVVRRIVAAHGGSFSIDSCLETGTVASVRLPVAF
jgi:signal transduction histidine kinase